MLHPRLNPKAEQHWVNPKTMETWEKEKTIKLDTLAQLVKRHLAEDGRQPFTMHEDGHTLIPDPTRPGETEKFDYPDKIVIFSAFPSSNGAILDVSQFLYLIPPAYRDIICRFFSCTISRLSN